MFKNNISKTMNYSGSIIDESELKIKDGDFVELDPAE